MNPKNLAPLLVAVAKDPKAMFNVIVSAAVVGAGVFWTAHMACQDASGCWNTARDTGIAAAAGAIAQHLRSPVVEVPPTA